MLSEWLLAVWKVRDLWCLQVFVNIVERIGIALTICRKNIGCAVGGDFVVKEDLVERL